MKSLKSQLIYWDALIERAQAITCVDMSKFISRLHYHRDKVAMQIGKK